MNGNWPRDLTEQIIAEFKRRPSLWDVNNPDYQDRKKRQSSLKEIYEILLKFETSVTPYIIKNKINSLRSQYRRELRSLEANSRRSGIPADEIKPTLWCFDQLEFLRNHVKIQQSLRNMHKSSSEKSSENMSEYVEESSGEDVELLNRYHNRTIIKLERTNNMKRKRNTSIQSPHKNKSRILPDENYDDNDGDNCVYNDAENDAENDADNDVDNDVENDVDNDGDNDDDDNGEQETIENDPIANNNSAVNDNTDLYGKCWAAEYRKLNTKQQIYAKRAIDEVLFQGRLGNLTQESTEIQIVS